MLLTYKRIKDKACAYSLILMGLWILNKQDFTLLGNVSESEISGHVCFQSKSERSLALEDQGLVSFVEHTINLKDGLPPMTVKGWVLSQKRHLGYCSECSKYCQED